MKATLKFDEDNISDREYLNRCLKSADLCLAITDIQNMIRGMLKEDPDKPVDLEWLQSEINDILDSRGVLNMDDLIS